MYDHDHYARFNSNDDDPLDPNTFGVEYNNNQSLTMMSLSSSSSSSFDDTGESGNQTIPSFQMITMILSKALGLASFCGSAYIVYSLLAVGRATSNRNPHHHRASSRTTTGSSYLSATRARSTRGVSTRNQGLLQGSSFNKLLCTTKACFGILVKSCYGAVMMIWILF